MVKSLKDLPYEARLRELGLPTLEYRRERADQIQVYKIIHGIDKIETEKFFTMSSYTQTRGHSLKLFKKRARLNVRKNCFSNRVVDGWNALPESVVTAPSLNTFKSRLNKHWRNQPYKFKAACYMTNQEIEGEHPSRSVYRSHEDLDDVQVQ